MNILSNLFGKINESRKELLKAYLQNGATLLDVRERFEYEMGCIPGSINIPLSSIYDTEKQIDKEKQIIVYCQSGGRSDQAIRALKRMGYQNLLNGGGWIDVARLIKAQNQ